MESIPVFDGHNDSLTRFVDKQDGRKSFLQENEVGHLDLPRAQRGNLAGGMFAIFTSDPERPDFEEKNGQLHEDWHQMLLSRAINPAYATEYTRRVMAYLESIEKESHGIIRVLRNCDELATCLQPEVLGVVLHFEGAEAIRELDLLGEFYEQGLRSLGLVWSRPNTYGVGVPFAYPASPDIGPGLTEPGKDLVRLCNELGIVVDVSHLNERGFWDVAKISQAPLIATHTAVHCICPCTRNLLDRQIDAIAASGGIIGINFASLFIRPDGKAEVDTPLEVIVRHFDYLIARVGVDHVGFGSDLDGAKIPGIFADVTGFPRLLQALTQRGYNGSQLRKIAHENWFRVLTQTWQQ